MTHNPNTSRPAVIVDDFYAGKPGIVMGEADRRASLVQHIRDVVRSAFTRWHANEHDDVVLIEGDIMHALENTFTGLTAKQPLTIVEADLASGLRSLKLGKPLDEAEREALLKQLRRLGL